MPSQPAFPHREILKSESSEVRLKALEDWLGKPVFENIKEGKDIHYPLGIVGPLPIKISDKRLWAFAPIATTEGALVASYQRGAKVLSESDFDLEVSKFENGQRVESKVSLSETVCKKLLKTTPEALYNYWEACAVGVQVTRSDGANGHFANGLTGLCLALGLPLTIPIQAALGQTICSLKPDGQAQVSISFELPGTEVNTPLYKWQGDAREIVMGVSGLNFYHAFPLVAGSLTLAGELSIMAAMAAGQFARAHERLGRR